ncbi:MAG: hypothetical protein U1F66_08880 [bacterium]
MGLNFQEPINPKNLEFLPSPSECPAEIFWPDTLKVPQEFVRQNTFMRGQNFLDTLLRSRQGGFPLEVKDTSLGFYLGLKGPAEFPKLKLGVPHDASLCAGPATGTGSGFDACEGLEVELKDADIGVNLEGLDLLSAQQLDLGIAKVLGLEVKKASVRDGHLLVTFKLNNPFFNAGLPLAYTNDGLLQKLNPTVRKLLQTAKPNPYDPDLHDIDVTDLLLEKMPVAYRASDGKGYTYAEYQAEPDKLGLKTVSYLFNIAREGKLPARLSFNQLYEAGEELRKNLKPAEKKQDDGQKELLQKLLDTISVRAKLHPNRVLLNKLFVEFEDTPGKNLIETQLTLHNLKEADVLLTAPLQISRLYSPGAVDILNLSGDLGMSFHTQGDSELRLDNLAMELGRLEYIGTKDKGPPGLLGLFGKLQEHFKYDPSKPGKFAILGGRITSVPDLLNNPLTALPALRVVGNPETGFQTELNLRLDAVRLRLPTLGEVTINGDISASARFIKQVEVKVTEDGKTVEIPHWVPEPNSLTLRLENLDLATQKGQHWSRASIEISDVNTWQLPSSTAPSWLNLKVSAPEMSGSAYRSLRVDGYLPIPRGPDGLYDFAALAQSFGGELLMHAIRVAGNPEDWNLKFDGTLQPEYTKLRIALDSTETDPAGALKRRPIEGLQINFQRDLVGEKTYYLLHAEAKQVDFPGIRLNFPKFDLSSTLEPTKNGGSLYTVSEFDLSANPWKSVPNQGLIQGPIWARLVGAKRKALTIEIDGKSPTFEIKNLYLDFGLLGITPEKLALATKGRITGVDIDGALRGNWKMDYEKFSGKGILTLAGDSGGEGDLHLRGADGLRLVKEDPRDPTRLVEIPIFSKTVWTLWNIRGVDPANERINGSFQLSTKVDPAFARVFGVIIDNGKLINWMMNHDHLPYTAMGYTKKMEEYISAKAAEDRKEAATKPKSGGTNP